MKTIRTKAEFEKIQELSKKLGNSIEVSKPTSGDVRFCLHWKNKDKNKHFFENQDLIKELFAKDYLVSVWGNNHICLQQGSGFDSIYPEGLAKGTQARVYRLTKNV
jgi:hypothetical protein